MIPLGNIKNADTCFELELAVSSALCDAFNTPHATKVKSLLSLGDWEGLKALEPDPNDYIKDESLLITSDTPLTDCILNRFDSDVMTFKKDRLLSRLLIKSDILPTGIDTEQVAMDLFRKIETINYMRTNLPALNAPWLHDFSCELNDLLAPQGMVDWTSNTAISTLVEYSKNGNGKSAAMLEALSISSDKYRESSSVSPSLSSIADAIKGEAWVTENPHIEICDTVKVATVPKTAFVDRTVSAVPLLDMRMQLSLGEALRELLLADGIDIRDQTRNQNLAQRANVLKLATIDLSSASSWFTERNLIGLIPNDLFELVDLLRPKFWEDVDRYAESESYSEKEENFLLSRHHSKKWTIKQMFNMCPMGCGYTFTLMTAYFWCLVKSIVPRSALQFCSVYGDDIIVPQKYAEELVSRLEYLGFEVNRKKSYLNGYFFESCGREYFCGFDVTPFYLRRSSEGDTDSAIPIGYPIQIANKLRLWSKDGSLGCDVGVKPIWNALRNKRTANSNRLMPLVPSILGDVGLIATREEAGKTVKLNDKGLEDVYIVKALRTQPTYICREDPFPYLQSLDHMAQRSLSALPVNENQFVYTKYRERPGNKPVFVALVRDTGTEEHELSLLPWSVVSKKAHVEFLRKNGLMRQTSLQESKLSSVGFSKGREPVKGLFGLPVIVTVETIWPDEGLFWSQLPF